MIRTLLGITFVTLLGPTILMGADTLSVVPLAKALQNSGLTDVNEAGNTARETVQSELWNSPGDDLEAETFRNRLAELARHRETRVGKLFFAAMQAVPDVSNLNPNLTAVTVIARWPLALEGAVQARIEYTRRGEIWKISTFELTVHGVAAAPISGLAPYFGEGEGDPEMLDFEPIDYLLGRDPGERQKPEGERTPFDYDAALAGIFESEDGAWTAMLDNIAAVLDPEAAQDFEDRVDVLKPHLATARERKALSDADASYTDESSGQDQRETRVAFWARLYKEVETTRAAPGPAAVPKRAGSRVEIEFVTANEGVERREQIIALRLGSGEISPRQGGQTFGITIEEEDDG